MEYSQKRKNFSYIELKVNDFVAVMHVETSHANLWQLRQSKALKWPISNTNVLDIFLPNVWHDFYYEWPCQKFQVSLYYWHGLFWFEECQRPRGGAPCQVDNPLSHHQQKRIDFNTANPFLDLLIHSLYLPRFGGAWKQSFPVFFTLISKVFLNLIPFSSDVQHMQGRWWQSLVQAVYWVFGRRTK